MMTPRSLPTPVRREEQESFWEKVTKEENGCWTWQGTRRPDGYGLVTIADGRYRAHRVAYELVKGAIPSGLVLDHLCRNTNCVNPEHLEAVTSGENSRRGYGAGFYQRSKTHCKKGHPFSKENTLNRKEGGRACRVCRKAAKDAWKARRNI